MTERDVVHVSLRMLDDVWKLRSRRCHSQIRQALYLQYDPDGARDFRVVDHSTQGNHIHLAIEAKSTEAMSRGMSSLCTSVAKRLNKVMGRKGKVFADRYHARVLSSPREVRHVLCYVLNNYRRHAQQWGERLPASWVDPYSSAAEFDGWMNRPPGLKPPAQPTCSPPRSWLRAVGWRKHWSLIKTSEVPRVMAGVPT